MRVSHLLEPSNCPFLAASSFRFVHSINSALQYVNRLRKRLYSSLIIFCYAIFIGALRNGDSYFAKFYLVSSRLHI